MMSGIRQSNRKHNPVITFQNTDGEVSEIDLSKLKYTELIDIKKNFELDCAQINKHMLPATNPSRFGQERALKIRRRLLNVIDHEFSYRKAETKVADVNYHFVTVAKRILDRDLFTKIHIEAREKMREAKDAENIVESARSKMKV